MHTVLAFTFGTAFGISIPYVYNRLLASRVAAEKQAFEDDISKLEKEAALAINFKGHRDK